VIEMLPAHEESIANNRPEPVQIWKARKFIEKNSDGEVSLRKVAKAVNISAKSFEREVQAGDRREFCGIRRAHLADERV
jgi:hypothetical protein